MLKATPRAVLVSGYMLHLRAIARSGTCRARLEPFDGEEQQETVAPTHMVPTPYTTQYRYQ